MSRQVVNFAMSTSPSASGSGRPRAGTFKSRFSKFLHNPHLSSGISDERPVSRSPSIVKGTLPIRYQKYANPVHSSYGFWKENILSLSKRERRLLETRFICQIFITVKDLQYALSEHNLLNAGQRIFSTLQWLLRTVYKGDMGKLIQRLEGITSSLKELLPNLDSQHVSQALHIFHNVFGEYFGDDIYSLQIRASFERLLSMAVDIADEQDFLAQETKIQSDTDFDDYMQSVESCLVHPLGQKYLQLFMRSQWNEELFLFWTLHSKFKASYGRAMIELSNEIMEEFIEDSSPNQINISYDARLAALKRHNNDCITSNMFNEALSEVMRLFKSGIWKDFSRTMKLLHYGDTSSVAPHNRMRSFTAPPQSGFQISVHSPLARASKLSLHNKPIPDSPPSENYNGSLDTPLDSPTEADDDDIDGKLKHGYNGSLTMTLTVPRISGSVSLLSCSSVRRRSAEFSQLLTPSVGWGAENDFSTVQFGRHYASKSSLSSEICFLSAGDQSDEDGK